MCNTLLHQCPPKPQLDSLRQRTSGQFACQVRRGLCVWQPYSVFPGCCPGHRQAWAGGGKARHGRPRTKGCAEDHLCHGGHPAYQVVVSHTGFCPAQTPPCAGSVLSARTRICQFSGVSAKLQRGTSRCEIHLTGGLHEEQRYNCTAAYRGTTPWSQARDVVVYVGPAGLKAFSAQSRHARTIPRGIPVCYIMCAPCHTNSANVPAMA